MVSIKREVTEWAGELLGSHADVESLRGGLNNYVFRCTAAGSSLIVKYYRAQNFGASSTRRDSEVKFLQHAAAFASGFVPKIVAIHNTLNMVAMSNIGGAVFTEKTIVTEDDISRALRFYRDINTDIEGISKYPVRAREGFVSVSEHLKHIEARISRFSPDHLSESLRPSARTIINVMHNIWERVNENVTRSLSAGLVANKISETNLQISPGDFGFHNAIRTSDGICFLDFEYSGLDDPAKTLLDFLAQPRCALFDAARAREFAFAAFPLLIDRDLLIKRAQALAPVITLKWLTIIYSFLDEARKINKIELSSAALAEKEIVARRVIKNLNNLNSGDSHPTAAFRFENFVLR